MRTLDLSAHNAEVSAVWEAYRCGHPTRVPLQFGINTRFTLLRPDANPEGTTFEQYFNDPQVMLERQLRGKDWVRHHVPQDAEMGLPADGWDVNVDLQNVYEAAWFGCDIMYSPLQVPDTLPLLQDDATKRSLLERGRPHPFRDGLMARNWEYYEYFVAQQESGYTYRDLPIKSVSPSGMGTDGPLTVACNLRGASEFLLDLVDDPDYALELLDFITEATIHRITAYRERLGQPLKTQGFGFADDSIQLISTALYEEMILPFHRRLTEAFSEGGPNFIHLCGNATRHFPFLVQKLNIGTFDTGFPVDFGALRATLGPDIEIFGGPSVPFLESATPDQTFEETRRVLQSGIMQGGRFVLREGNNLAPEITLDNLWAMYDAVHAYGYYDELLPALDASIALSPGT